MDRDSEAGQPVHQPWQVKWRLNAARLAYGLNSCDGFVLDRKQCDIDDGPHEVVYADYNLSSLDVIVVDVNEHGAFSRYHVHVENLGTMTSTSR